MNVSLFARVDLPDHRDKSFDGLMLGKLGDDRGRAVGPGDEARKTTDVGEVLRNARDNYFHGFYLDGLKDYARVLRTDQQQVEAWIGQVRILVDIGRPHAAVYWADNGLEHFSDSKVMAFAKAFALAHAGRIEHAKRIINIPVAKDEAAVVWLFRGEVLVRIKLGLFQKIFKPYKGIGRMGAFFCFLKALSPDPKDAFLHQRVGLAYMLAKYDERAFEHLQTSLTEVPDNPLTLYGLAECYRRKNDHERALYYVKKAIAKNPNLDIAYELLQLLHHPVRKLVGRLFSMKGKGRS
jgi:tetratricopeptide (TPR) repeat protein